MSEPRWQDEFRAPLRTLQIIVAAMVAGTLCFLVIAVVMVQQQAPEAPAEPLLTYMAVAAAAVGLISRMAVDGAIESRGRRSIHRGTWRPPQSAGGALPQFIDGTGDAGKLLFILYQKVIVSAAMLEGVAFFLVIAYLIEGTTLALIVASLMIVSVTLHFPTQRTAARWLGEQLERIDQERQFDDRG